MTDSYAKSTKRKVDETYTLEHCLEKMDKLPVGFKEQHYAQLSPTLGDFQPGHPVVKSDRPGNENQFHNPGGKSAGSSLKRRKEHPQQ